MEANCGTRNRSRLIAAGDRGNPVFFAREFSMCMIDVDGTWHSRAVVEPILGFECSPRNNFIITIDRVFKLIEPECKFTLKSKIKRKKGNDQLRDANGIGYIVRKCDYRKLCVRCVRYESQMFQTIRAQTFIVK